MLARSGEPEALADALQPLLESSQLRARIAAAGRESYLANTPPRRCAAVSSSGWPRSPPPGAAEPARPRARYTACRKIVPRRWRLRTGAARLSHGGRCGSSESVTPAVSAAFAVALGGRPIISLFSPTTL